MTTESKMLDVRVTTGANGVEAFADKSRLVFLVVALALLVVIYRAPFRLMYINWTALDSYYSHGFLIPLVSLWLAWLKRKEFFEAPPGSSTWGLALMAVSGLVVLASDFLGFSVFGQLSFVPMLAGLALVFLGPQRTLTIWFPLVFLFAMIPLPGSVTQSLALNLKLFAAGAAVKLAGLFALPMVQDGSFIHFKDDFLLIGDVCGGLRSLIALLAIGVLMAYFSKTRPWAKVLVLLMSGPIAIIANVTRIFGLCVVGYVWGSDVASGRVHDASGILIFAVAFALFFTLEALLRKLAPEQTAEAAP